MCTVRARVSRFRFFFRSSDACCFSSRTRLALCEFTLEDSARLGVDPAALDSGSPSLSPLRAASDNPSAKVLARAHEVVMETCKRSRCGDVPPCYICS